MHASGRTDPDVLASMRDVRCRESFGKIRAALVGNYQPEHVFALAQALALYDGRIRKRPPVMTGGLCAY